MPSGEDAPSKQTQDAIAAMTRNTPHGGALGMEITKVENARAYGRAAFREDLVGDAESEVIAGGVIIAFLDQLAGAAVMAALGKLHPIATLDLRIDYMRPARPRQDVRAEAHCYKVTRSIAFVRAVAYEDSPDDPVANATAAFMLTAPIAKAKA
ncbi:MAG: PaaI family thioesterase [Hyphomonadaceae bacterium]